MIEWEEERKRGAEKARISRKLFFCGLEILFKVGEEVGWVYWSREVGWARTGSSFWFGRAVGGEGRGCSVGLRY